ncbi:flavin-binding monooxygenase-like protein [Xylogone sp. PMI_703]|nr:flavin-binding monooxygenase-like protein [Xylogone sp. PMI_703]
MGSALESLPPHTNSQGYTVPDVTYADPQNRRMRVVTVGAGYSGILLAYKLAREVENVEHVIYEKNGDIGGTWLENKYPNCACDVPSHSYVYDFALNPYWKELYSKSDAIWNYLDRVCRVFDLRKYMHFNCRILDAVWSQDIGKWALKVERTYADESTEIFSDNCDVLLHAAGFLNISKIPDIEGLETFKGRIIHTAAWPEDFGAEQWKDKRMAVIGAGASSVQTTPGLQSYAQHIDLFVRSRTWLASSRGQSTTKPYFTTEEQEDLANNLEKLVAKAREYELSANSLWQGMFLNSPEQQAMVEQATKIMTTHLERPDLIDGFVPDFAVGCRRTTPGVAFMHAVAQPNVTVHFTGVHKILPDGVVGTDGKTVTGIDTIVCATGFDTSYRPSFHIIGQEGVSMADRLTPRPDSYFGVSVPGFPNYIRYGGPSFPVLSGSLTAAITAITDLAIAMIKKIQLEDIRSIAPRVDATKLFVEHTQAMLHGTVWEDTCNSWYKHKSGYIASVWPGSGLHYQAVIRNSRWEDWEIKHMNPHNLFAYLGRGFTKALRDPNADLAPYMNINNLDKAFYDFEKFPAENGPAPTVKQAAERSRLRRPVPNVLGTSSGLE